MKRPTQPTDAEINRFLAAHPEISFEYYQLAALVRLRDEVDQKIMAHQLVLAGLVSLQRGFVTEATAARKIP